MQNEGPLGIGTNRGFLGKVFGITWLPIFPLIQMLWRLKIDIKLKISYISRIAPQINAKEKSKGGGEYVRVSGFQLA